MKRQPLRTAPESLEPLQRQRIRAWAGERWPFLKSRQLFDEWERCRDWHLANGVLRACWEATFRNWLRKAASFEGQRIGANPYATRPKTSSQHSELQPLLRVLGDLE